MAITTSYNQLMTEYNPKYWKSEEEFIAYQLRRYSETLADRNYYTDKDGVQHQIPFIDHHPELAEYEVWMGGYMATGEHGKAHLLGKVKARNFVQACDIIQCTQHLAWIEKVNHPDYKEYCPPSKWTYDPSRLTDWGCALYWDEENARKFCG